MCIRTSWLASPIVSNEIYTVINDTEIVVNRAGQCCIVANIKYHLRDYNIAIVIERTLCLRLANCQHHHNVEK